MTEEEKPESTTGKGISGFFKDLIKDITTKPLLAFGIAAGVGLVSFYLYRQKQSSAKSSSSSASPGGSSVNGIDYGSIAGIPYGYEDQFLNNGNNSQPPTTTNNNNNSTSVPTATIRSKTSQGIESGYDKGHSGVPMRINSNNGGVIGTIPYGTQVTLSGSAVSGGNNFGNNQWYQVTYNGNSGYVSALDLINIQNAGGGRINFFNSPLDRGFHHTSYQDTGLVHL